MQLPYDDNYLKLIRYSKEILTLYNCGDYSSAVVEGNNARDFARSTFGNKSNEYASTSIELAQLYRKKKENYSLAESIFKEALKIQESIFGPNHPKSGEICFFLGTLTLSMGKPDEAWILLNRAISIRNLVKEGWNEDISRELDILIASFEKGAEERIRIKIVKETDGESEVW